MGNQTDEIRIYVACLASYNEGVLHGCWIDATQGVDGIWRDASAMLLKSPAEYAEEWAIHDYEGFERVNISEYEGFESVAEIAAFIEEHGALGGKVLDYYGDLESAKTALDDHYAGEYKTVASFAEEITEETTKIPESLRFYIDYDHMARDLEINDILAIETAFHEVHIFWSH